MQCSLTACVISDKNYQHRMPREELAPEKRLLETTTVKKVASRRIPARGLYHTRPKLYQLNLCILNFVFSNPATFFNYDVDE